MSMKEWDRLPGKNKIVLSLKTEISELMVAGTVVGFLQDVKARAIETASSLKRASETSAVSGSLEKMLTETVSSLTEEFSSVHVERANFGVELDERTTLVQRRKEDVGKLPTVSSKTQKIYDDTVHAFNPKTQKDFVNG